MLSMKKIQKVYRTDMIETHALHDFSIEVKAAEFVAVMGRSGSGKTTFLNIAGLLDTFDKGTYHLDGQDVSRLSDNEMSKIRNQKIGFIFQSFNLIPDLDVFDNIDVPLRYRRLPAAERRERVEKAVRTVGLLSRLHHLPSQLSGGQQQRVAIARVLAGDPRLILADEPTGDLDTLMSREVMDLMEKINESGTTIVMVTHTPECASRASRQIHLLDGEVVDLNALPSEDADRSSASLASTLQ
jgi:putative ABC transport system ATP-binding protein